MRSGSSGLRTKLEGFESNDEKQRRIGSMIHKEGCKAAFFAGRARRYSACGWMYASTVGLPQSTLLDAKSPAARKKLRGWKAESMGGCVVVHVARSCVLSRMENPVVESVKAQN